jgi:cell division protein FtsB
MARRTRTRSRRRVRLLRVLAGGGLALIALFYYQPVRSYFETRQAVGGRLAEVRELRKEHRHLERRLKVSTSDAALEREARRLGYVKPGERLFIVTGIEAWERHRATLRALGRPPTAR